MTWIQTYSNLQFYPLDPKVSDINILDIAHALSNICRFTGHCREFFSVAQHSVLVSQRVPAEDALWGLLHDASETWAADLARPVKRAVVGYSAVEDRLMAAVVERFGLFPREMPVSVHLADNRMLLTEARDLMGPPPEPWTVPGEPYPEPLGVCWRPAAAREAFLRRFYQLAPALTPLATAAK